MGKHSINIRICLFFTWLAKTCEGGLRMLVTVLPVPAEVISWDEHAAQQRHSAGPGEHPVVCSPEHTQEHSPMVF